MTTPRPLVAWLRRRPFLAALAVLLVVMVPGFVRVEQIAASARRAAASADATALALEREIAATDYQTCTSRVDVIVILRRLVEESSSVSGGLGLTSVEGFEELSPETQRWVANLEARLEAPPPDPVMASWRDRAMALLEVPTCVAPFNPEGSVSGRSSSMATPYVVVLGP